jgi:hypothetical protein
MSPVSVAERSKSWEGNMGSEPDREVELSGKKEGVSGTVRILDVGCGEWSQPSHRWTLRVQVCRGCGHRL